MKFNFLVQIELLLSRARQLLKDTGVRAAAGSIKHPAFKIRLFQLPLALAFVAVPLSAAEMAPDRRPVVQIGAAYPNRPVRFIVPFPPGGSDTVARMIGQKFSETFGQQFVIDNRAGAAGTLGAGIAAKAPADGYTIMFATASFAISASLYRNLPYDSIKDFTAVGLVSSGPMLVVAHPSLPIASIRDLVALAKAKPDTLNFASTGTGTITHLAAELFKSMTGVRMTHIPYKGSGPAQTDLLAGQVQLMFDVIGAALPHARAGTLKALAVTSAKRSALVPDLPTVAESGVPGYDASTWYGVLAPRGTPRSVVNLLSDQIVVTLNTTEFRERLAGLGFEPQISTPEQFADFLRADIAKWARAIKDAGVSVN
jgi:tripartite-type tricarboxylate transporter receptor subunit TctC